MALAIIVAKCCSKDEYIRNIYTYGLAFSNFGFMGNAVVSVVFPNMFVDYLIFTMPLWTMIYLWGVPCLLIPSQGEKQTIKSRLQCFLQVLLLLTWILKKCYQWKVFMLCLLYDWLYFHWFLSWCLSSCLCRRQLWYVPFVPWRCHWVLVQL